MAKVGRALSLSIRQGPLESEGAGHASQRPGLPLRSGRNEGAAEAQQSLPGLSPVPSVVRRWRRGPAGLPRLHPLPEDERGDAGPGGKSEGHGRVQIRLLGPLHQLRGQL